MNKKSLKLSWRTFTLITIDQKILLMDLEAIEVDQKTTDVDCDVVQMDSKTRLDSLLDGQISEQRFCQIGTIFIFLKSVEIDLEGNEFNH